MLRFVTRRVRVKLGPNVHAYGGGSIPDDRIVILPEAEAAAALRDRHMRGQIEFIEYVEDHTHTEAPERNQVDK
jgi:hypothetical protein